MSWSRRRVIGAAGASLLAPGGAQAAADKLVVADPGGPYRPAFKAAFYDPFEKATGIQVVPVAHETNPVAQVKAMVDAQALLWDVIDLSPFQTTLLDRLGDYLEPVGVGPADFPGMLPVGMTRTSAGIDVFATVFAYRTDSFPKVAPASWADFWDPVRFPGRRALRRTPQVLDLALLADGVPPAELYPLDVERAFRSLDRIKPHIAIWSTSAAQVTQLLDSGEVDLTDASNGRAQASIDGGAPVRIVWNQGLYQLDVWAIPKGCPRLGMAQSFVRFCCQADRQAVVSETLAYGPANLDAFRSISAARAALLPTAPENLKLLRPLDDGWWASHYSALFERFNAWLLG